MKRAFAILLLAGAVCTTASAQQPEPAASDSLIIVHNHKYYTESDDISPEKLEMRKIVLQIIRNELKLTDEQFERFAPTYHEYRHNIRSGQTKVSCMSDLDNVSDAEINTMLTAKLDNYIHIAMVRKVDIPIFEKILTPRQIYILYNIDNKLAKQAHDELQRRKNRK